MRQKKREVGEEAGAAVAAAVAKKKRLFKKGMGGK